MNDGVGGVFPPPGVEIGMNEGAGGLVPPPGIEIGVNTGVGEGKTPPGVEIGVSEGRGGVFPSVRNWIRRRLLWSFGAEGRRGGAAEVRRCGAECVGGAG